MLPTMAGPHGKGKGRGEVPEDIKRRAQRQAERTSRLLDARQRTIGVDKDALDRQVQEHQQQNEDERDFEQTEAERLRRACEQADEEEYQRRLDETQQRANLYHYWQVQQRSPKQEWDLNDPQFLKKDAPPRTSDYVPPECTVSSLQVFDAENRRIETPRRNRKELIEENDRLMREHEVERQREADTKRYEDEVLLNTAKQAEDEEMQRQADRVKREVDLRETQKQMDRYRKHRENRLREEDEKMAQDHINTMRDSALIVEDRTIGYRFDDPNRPRPDHFKGFSQEEIQEIHRTQGRQMEEKEALREEDRKCSEESDRHTLETIQKGNEMEQALRDSESRNRVEYYEHLRRQAKYDRKMRKNKIKDEREYQEVFNNSILSRFGTSLV
eukprot:gb/GECG01009825.1/.p1 GENE.gb/GECG01009825.1/~~gb/GECG01009825.1/.p1  ORF type:complete len:387 (+),score=85.32 gb/GECG01009825.1/:1-1161(+)